MFYHQMGNGNGLSDSRLGKLSGPLAKDFIPGQTPIKLLQYNPHHDPSAFERGLPAADLGVGHNVPPQLDPPSGCFPFHVDAPHYASGTCPAS